MTEEEESDAIPINKNPINIFTKTKVKLPATIPNYINKKMKELIPQNKLSKKKIFRKINYQKIIINNIKKYYLNICQLNNLVIDKLILNKPNHITSIYKENYIFYLDNEFLKRYYTNKESIKRFPKFYLYYKNYFKFFLKPVLSDLFLCEILRKNGDKQANYFYEKYHCDENKNKDNKNKIDYMSIFTKSQKKEIENANNNSKNILIKENNQSTIVFSYESLNNSKIKNNELPDDTSISFLSIANLINNKNMKLKNKENKEENYKQNKIKLFLNLNDKNNTQKSSTILTSARSKKMDTIKEKNNINIINNYNNNYFYFKCNNNNNNNENFNIKTINNKKNENNGNIIKNKKTIEFDIYLDYKKNNLKKTKNTISSGQIKTKTIFQREIRDYSKGKSQKKDIMIIPTKKEIRKKSYVNTNINIDIKPKTNFKSLIFTNESKKTNPYSYRYSNTKRAPLKLDYYKSTQIINNNKTHKLHSSASELKKSINITEKMNHDFIINKNMNKNLIPTKYRDYYVSTTQITKVKKKIPSRNISCDLVQNQKGNNIIGKNIYFSVYGLSNLKHNEILNKNNKLSIDYDLFYKTFKKENYMKNIKMSIDNERKNIYKNESDRRGLYKNNLHSSSLEYKKYKLNKLIKDLESLTLLKNDKINNICGQEQLAVIEYKKKNKKNKKI